MERSGVRDVYIGAKRRYTIYPNPTEYWDVSLSNDKALFCSNKLKQKNRFIRVFSSISGRFTFLYMRIWMSTIAKTQGQKQKRGVFLVYFKYSSQFCR